MVNVAFKEWAVVCEALASGRQNLILRKGGIHEVGGSFRPEYDRFWLYPTYFHEQRAGIRPEALPLFETAEAARAPEGFVWLAQRATVQSVEYCREWVELMKLESEHIWSDATVQQRFEYRTPGLYLFRVVVESIPVPLLIPERPEYAGCKTWVPLEATDLAAAELAHFGTGVA